MSQLTIPAQRENLEAIYYGRLKKSTEVLGSLVVEHLMFQVAVKSSYESKARSLVRSELPFFLPEIRYSRVGVS